MTEPLVPAEVDLRDFPFFPIEFRRLFASDTWILGNAEERCAAMCLWLESWHGTPAGSVPDNDRILAHLSQAGSRWNKVRAHVMRGFVKCSDGRFYHPVVSEKALEAWAKHKKASSKGKAGALKRWGTGISASNSAGIGQLMPNDSKGSGSGSGSGTEKDITPTTTPALCAADPVFGDGLELLKSKGLAEPRARKFLGLQRQKYGDTAVAQVVADAAKNDITDPIPWFIAALDRHARTVEREPSGTAKAILALENMK